MDKSFQFENITIHFPDAIINEFWFRVDAAEKLNTETTEEAVRLIKKRMKLRGIRNVFVDPESDGVSFSSKSGEKIFELAAIVNEMVSSKPFHYEEYQALFREEITNYVPKKGQSFTIGDFVIVPIKDAYGIMQIIDKHEGDAICILFNIFFKSEAELKSFDVNLFTQDNVFSAIGLQNWFLTDYTFKVLRKNAEPLAKVIYNNRRNRLIEESVPGLIIGNLFQEKLENESSELILKNEKKLKNIEWCY